MNTKNTSSFNLSTPAALSEWTLQTHCRKLFLEGYEVDAHIGIHEFERESSQKLIIDIELYVPLDLCTPFTDSINEVVDYDFIRKVVQAVVQRGHINLQETLVDEVINSLISHPSVWAVRMSSYKPDVYPDCAGVGVEVFRLK